MKVAVDNDKSLDEEFWNKYFRVYDVINKLIPYNELLNIVINELESKTGDVILDAGSGTGNLAVRLEGMGVKIVGIDIAKTGVAMHKAKIPTAEVVVGDLSKPLLFSDGRFDKVCSINTIFTVPKSKRQVVFGELYRVLKPGGKIVVVNLATGYKPLKIYIDHIRQFLKIEGLFATFVHLSSLLVPTLRMFYYGLVIKRHGRGGDADLLEPDEQTYLLEKSGFKGISKTKRVFTKQAILNSAYRL